MAVAKWQNIVLIIPKSRVQVKSPLLDQETKKDLGTWSCVVAQWLNIGLIIPKSRVRVQLLTIGEKSDKKVLGS
jgi:hypothetical protein